MRRGLPLPNKIADAPELLPGLGLYLRAFYDLGTCRPIGMAEGPIPWTAIESWCDSMHIDEETRDDVHYLVNSLDEAYMLHKSKKQPPRK